MLGFDYNQPQSATSSMDYWGLVSVRDTDGALADMHTSTVGRNTGLSYAAFSSTEARSTTRRASTDFATVYRHHLHLRARQPRPTRAAACPAASGSTGPLIETIDNALGTANAEFLAFLPELYANLDAHHIAGRYDTLSVPVLFGLFRGNAKGQYVLGA